jgi:hypothetical protein
MMGNTAGACEVMQLGGVSLSLAFQQPDCLQASIQGVLLA